MNLRAWIIIVAVLACIEVWVWRKDSAMRAHSGNSSLIDTALLDTALLEKTHRIVIREKPQVKVVSREEGFEVRTIPDKDAPIRETILERHDGQDWVVANYFGLDVDKNWLGQTMSDLSQGRLVRFVASDPELMSDLELDIGHVRLEDQNGRVIHRLDFGKKDGRNSHQFVRVNEQDAFVTKHETEIVGDPPSWIVGRVLRFDPAEIREVEIPFSDANEKPLVLKRPARGAPFVSDDVVPAMNQAAAQATEKIVGRLLLESAMLAVDNKAPAVAEARKNITARLSIALFDGREYTVSYATLPKTDAPVAELDGYDESNAVLVFFTCTDAKDIVMRYDTKAALVYNRGSTLGRLPKNRADLLAGANAPAPGSP
jgi:hypothetical protein